MVWRLAAVSVLVLGLQGSPPAAVPDRDPKIVTLVAAVSQERLVAILKRLEAFQTRNTLSTVGSPTRGIGAAREWILGEMQSYSPRLQVSFDTYRLAAQGRITRDVEIRNVMAVLPGRSARRIYISGHYDTVAIAGGDAANPLRNAQGELLFADPDSPAPGVDDDGSGTALTMELARVFSQSGIDFDATLVFMCHVAEEQGLFGARLHAQKAAADHVAIEAVFNNDIVGGDRGGDGTADGATIRVYSEGPDDSPSRALARYVERWAARYVPSHRVRLMARPDRFLRGGDHSAYNEFGFAAVGFRESREDFSRQHSARDTFDDISPAYLTENARVNAAAAATLALAPPPPVVTTARGQPTLGRTPGAYDADLRWSASPGAAAYRIFWRPVWGPDWQHDLLVGNATEVVLPDMQIDDYVFGVAALDAAGHESYVSAYVEPPRQNPPIALAPEK